MKTYKPGDDLEFMNTPDLWPNWPLLPINRYPEAPKGPECGILVACHECRNTVFLVNMFSLEAGSIRDILIDKTEVKRIAYPSAEAILADGWIVD